MHDTNFIIRKPLLDPKERVAGYGLTWQRNGAAPAQADPNALTQFVAAQLHDTAGGWQLTEGMLYLEVSPVRMPAETLEMLSPKNVVFTLNADELDRPGTGEAVKALRERGFGISAQYADLAAGDQSLFASMTHAEVYVNAMDAAALTALSDELAQLPQPSMQMIVCQVENWEQFDVCASLHFLAYAGRFFLTPRPGNQAKGLNPAQTMILQLMQLVKQNADVKQLEAILRRDAALSYKLLRYINSAGFGLGTEIQSLRHAVTMLGYSPLYRWLSLLLATANSTGFSPALMQTAVIRGRFVELLGHSFFPKNEAENLFVAGMFSLLDRLLGIPMEQVLENIQLSNAVTEALLTRGGVYGPFLALAESCELPEGDAGTLADSLFVSAGQVNQAHLAALVWTQNLKL